VLTCDHCPDECLIPSIDDINFLLADMDAYIIGVSGDFASFYSYGYPKANFDNIRKLRRFKSILVDMKNQILYNGKCICLEYFSRLRENIVKLIGKQDAVSKQEVDRSKQDQWLLKNPGCIAYETWEKALYQVCNKIEVYIDSIKRDECKFIYEIAMKPETECMVVYEVVQDIAECFVEYSVKANIKECKYQYEIVKLDKKCTPISFEIYVKLVECGLSYDIIKKSLSCGITFGLDKKNQNCILCIYQKKQLPLTNNCKELYSIMKSVNSCYL
jgi:hypothetical protein